MTNAEEAIGVVRAATAVSLPVVISFTVETDGRLPGGLTIGDAIDRVDQATSGAPAYYMVNCAHPTHFAAELDPGREWVRRIGGIRANASRLSHAELDEATELDRGDITEFASLYGELSSVLPLLVVGGCCGTDDEHARNHPPHPPRGASQPLTAIAEMQTLRSARTERGTVTSRGGSTRRRRCDQWGWAGCRRVVDMPIVTFSW